jgi:hypothetical protein
MTMALKRLLCLRTLSIVLSCPEIQVDLGQLSRFHLKSETESSLKKFVIHEYWTLNNVQKQ